MIELIRSVRALCGVRRTFVDWHFQSRMDQTTSVHNGLNFFIPSYQGTSALCDGDTRHVQPIALRDGITEWSQNVLQGRGRPERRGPGGTDFFNPVKVRSYGVVEHLLAYAVPGGLPDLP